MSSIVHYEIYVYQSGSWDLLERYPSERRTEAMEHAKRIELSESKPVKVIKETYDLDTQTFFEALVYLSDIPKQSKSSNKNYSRGGGKVPQLTAASGKGNGKRPVSAAKLTEGVMMLVVATIFSMIGSGLLTAAIIHIMSSMGFGDDLLSSHFVLGLFTFLFLLISIPTAAKWVDWNSLATGTKYTPQSDKRSKVPNGYKYSERELYGSKNEEIDPTASVISHLMRKVFDSVDGLLGRKTLKDRIAEAEKTIEQKEAAEKQQDEQQQRQTEEELNKKRQQEEAAAAAAKEQKEKEDEETRKEEERQAQEEKERLTGQKDEENGGGEPQRDDLGRIIIPSDLESDYLKLTTFLSIILKVLQKKNILLNTYIRFGLELMLAGACDQISKTKNLTRDQNRLLLMGLLGLLGRAPTLADMFFDKIDEYMMEPKYLPVIESGSKCMDIYLKNPSSPELISQIQSTVLNWIKPDKKEQNSSSGIYTIMFTDMVSSTQMTQTLGDKLAQQLIHKHNAIVRQALATCGGEEIKQTGDGIMASFAWASNGIDAAIQIQREILRYNKASPTVPLGVRIGLNAGEPIVENNDLYGLTVQMAARVCAQADHDQIYVSSVVKELAAGKNYSFTSAGTFNLKGIDEPQQLYSVQWQETAAPTAKDDDADKQPETPPQPEELANVLPEF